MKDFKKLDSDKILLFVDHKRSIIWLWLGIKVTTRMKFIFVKQAQNIREKYGSTYKIIAVDKGNEPSDLKEMIEKFKPGDDDESIQIYPFNSHDPPGGGGAVGLNFQGKVLEGDLEFNSCCKHCGSILPEGQSICHVCGKMVI